MEEARGNRPGIARSLAGFRDMPDRPRALVGFDGYVDKLVKPRRSQALEDCFDTVREFAETLLSMGGTSSDIAVSRMFEKIGGNGPLLADALADKGVPCTCIGAMGEEALPAPYRALAEKVTLYSVAECASSYVMEFNDGKIMLGDTDSFLHIGWKEVQDRLGSERLLELFARSRLTCFTNWSGLPRSTELLEGIIEDICPNISDTQFIHTLFFDLADPTAKSPAQFQEFFSALERLRSGFERVVGLNPKECMQVYNHFYGKAADHFDSRMAEDLLRDFPADEIVVHDAGCAYAGKTGGTLRKVSGRFLERPLISVGAGDNFNSGYCLGKLCSLPPADCAALGNESAVLFMQHCAPASLTQLTEAFRDDM